MASPSSNHVAQAVAVAEIQDRIEELKDQLNEANNQLERITSEEHTNGNTNDHTNGNNSSLVHVLARNRSTFSGAPMGKKGYLFKWQDRSIGWGGTKWALRFVTLEKGKLSYYGSHKDGDKPRYVLSLRGCAVRDEGFKTNRRHKSSKSSTPPPLEEPGAYYHVFSVYQRPLESFSGTDADTGADGDHEFEDIVPLLRFSTPSLADKTQWIQLLSESCAYCDSEAFLIEMQQKEAEREKERGEQMKMMFPEFEKHQKGTLPPLYFAPAEPKKNIVRRPSGILKPKAEMYRTKSGNLLDAAKSNQPTRSGYPPSRPMHRNSTPSYLSAEAKIQNYRGFFNLAMIVLVVSNFRLIQGTIRHHGNVLEQMTLMDWSKVLDHPFTEGPFVVGFLMLQVLIINTFVVEWLLSRYKIGEKLGMTMHFVNTHAALFGSCAFVWTYMDDPVKGAFLLFHGVITWMKLVSYTHANEDYRTTGKVDITKALIEDLDPEEEDISYPNNVSLSNIYYFWFAPTLTYQMAFPRTPEVRFWKVVGIVVRLVFAVSLFLFLMAQVIAPNLSRLVEDLKATNGVYTPKLMAEYWLKLAIANTYGWLLMFYIYFHLYLNLFAELLRFGDRVFYKDWWNSSEVSAYWRLWNMPVHYWLVRHVYFPSIRLGLSKGVSTFIVFFLSAVVHEILVSVPFHMVRPWSFLGMMMQMPLVAVTKYIVKHFSANSLGNIVFWVSFCVVGQPMAILLYTADYQYGQLGFDSCAELAEERPNPLVLILNPIQSYFNTGQ